MRKISYDQLISELKERFEEEISETLVIEFYCKYDYKGDDEYEHMIEVCGYEQDNEAVVWFNDWYEGQNDIKLQHIFKLETLVKVYDAAFKCVTETIFNTARSAGDLFEFRKGDTDET